MRALCYKISFCFQIIHALKAFFLQSFFSKNKKFWETYMYFKTLFRRYRTSNMGFDPQFPTFLSLSHFQCPVKSQIIEDKHSILCFCEQNDAHFTYNSEPTYQYKKKLTYCHLKIVIFAKSGKFLDFLAILASRNSAVNLQNTHIFGFAGTTPSL